MAELLPNVNYTVNDLKEILGDDFMTVLTRQETILPSPNKSPVYTYNDLDENSKIVFNGLYNLLSSINDEAFLLFAVGNRVTGNWRTSQETQDINNQYQATLLTTPYEYWATAKIFPSSEYYGSIEIDAPIILNPSNETHRVIIPPPNE